MRSRSASISSRSSTSGASERAAIASTCPGRADDRARLEHGPLSGVERVEARRHEAAQRHRDLGRAEGGQSLDVDGPLRFADQCRQLLDEERVAAAAVAQHLHQLGRRPLGQEVTDEDRGGFAIERVEVDDGRVVAPGRRRPPVLQLGARRHRDDERERPEAHEEAVDQLEHLLVGPVEVGEHQDERLLLGQRDEERLHRSDGVLAGAGGIDVDAFVETAEHEEEAVGEALDLGVVRVDAECLGQDLLDPCAHLLDRSFGVEIAGLADRLRDRPPHVGLAVRDALPAQDHRTALVLRDGGQLAGEPALADAGFPEQQHELCAFARQRRVEQSPEQCHLGLAADEQGRTVGVAVAWWRNGLDRGPRLDGALAALDDERPERLEPDGSSGRLVGEGTDDDLSGSGNALQATGGVHDVTHRRVVAAGPQRADEHLARVDADAHLRAYPVLVAQARERPLHLQRGAHGALGVVLVRDRSAEERDDGVADDLVDLAAERGDVGDETLEALVDEVLHRLGVGRPRENVVNPTRSANRTVAIRRSSGRLTSEWPHEGQKRAPSGAVAPHDGQVMAKG